MQKTTRRDLLQLSGAAYLGTLFGGPFPLKALAQTATRAPTCSTTTAGGSSSIVTNGAGTRRPAAPT